MLKYEIKKIFVKKSSKIAVLVLLVLTLVVCTLAIQGVSYVNEDGDTEYGYVAIQKLKQAKGQWSGELTTKQLEKVIEENLRINDWKQEKSEDLTQSNIAYGKKQGFNDIRQMINYSFGKFQAYDYYRIDSVSKENVGKLYENRIQNLKEWLAQDAKEQIKFSKEEEAYLIKQYEELKTPFFYEYADGWHELLEYSSTLIMLMVLILGFLAADIFSGEFYLKADAIFYSSYFGRNKAVKNKIVAGIITISTIYWVFILLFTSIVLGVLGAGGGNCAIQTSMACWKSFYNITYIQEYLLILVGGYIGTLFILLVTMYFSAKTRSTVLAVVVPFVLVFIPSFLSNFSVLNKILALLPDQLLQISNVVSYFNLYQVGDKVIPAMPILLGLYLLLSILFIPLLYQSYRKAQIK